MKKWIAMLLCLLLAPAFGQAEQAVRLPVEGKVLSVHETVIYGVRICLIITEDGDSRRLWVIETDLRGNETVRKTLPLPGDAALEVPLPGDGLHSLTLTWNDGVCSASFKRRADGAWLLYACSMGQTDGISLRVGHAGLLPGAGRPVPSTFNALTEELFHCDLAHIFERAQTRRSTGWAVVESFMAELYAAREDVDTGRYVARLWQGTPLRILEQDGGWCRVALGDTDVPHNGLTGWVHLARLATEDAVYGAALLPDLAVVDDGQITSVLPVEYPVTGEYVWPVGETADGAQAILLMPDGAVGYCPSRAVLPGNG